MTIKRTSRPVAQDTNTTHEYNPSAGGFLMRVQTNVKAGGLTLNHNQSATKVGLPVKTQVKTGGLRFNHNETVAKAGLTVKKQFKKRWLGIVVGFVTLAMSASTSQGIGVCSPPMFSPQISPTSQVVIFKDCNAWFSNENRNENILQGLDPLVAPLPPEGNPFNPLRFVRGIDFDVLPTSAITAGIPPHVRAVILESNSTGQQESGENVRDPAAQTELDEFVRNGGTLIAHMGGNAPPQLRYFVPGLLSTGRTDDGDSGFLGLAVADHPFVRGPDGLLGTADDTTTLALDFNAPNAAAHQGSLSGILPPGVTVLLVGDVGQPVYAAYRRGAGQVLVTTITVEIGVESHAFGFSFRNGHPSQLLVNHLHWALTTDPEILVPVPDIVGLSQADAEAAIVAAGFVVGTIDVEQSATVSAGHVIRQDPVASSEVVEGSPVDLVIATPAPVSLGDFVWEDRNADGIQDAGESGVAGVTVHLFDISGNLIDSTVTDASGLYLFSELVPGDYAVEFEALAGFTFSPQDQGADDTVDSDADPTTGRTGIITVTGGESDRTFDAGFMRESVSFLCDANNDGCVDMTDVNIITGAIFGGAADSSWDCNGDGTVNVADPRYLIENLLGTGDCNG